MKNSAILFFLSLFMTSCGSDIQDYKAHLLNPENGLVQSFKSKSNEYKLLYNPKELIAERESQNSEQSKRQILKELGTQDYFLMELVKSNSENPTKEDFYYAYQFEKDIYQLVQGDTLRPSLYQLEQGIAGSKQLRINLAFPLIGSDRRIYINDKHGETFSLSFSKTAIAEISDQKLKR